MRFLTSGLSTSIILYALKFVPPYLKSSKLTGETKKFRKDHKQTVKVQRRGIKTCLLAKVFLSKKGITKTLQSLSEGPRKYYIRLFRSPLSLRMIVKVVSNDNDHEEIKCDNVDDGNKICIL